MLVTPKKFLFRVDASHDIGTGHVMRCLTLADRLRSAGGGSIFICREHGGHLADLIRSRGHVVELLPKGTAGGVTGELAHSAWLGDSQSADAAAVSALAESFAPDWIIVDHYGLDVTWEEAVGGPGRRIMAIDDLADRRHCCHILLDQNLGRQAADYDGLTPSHCRILTGARYALLRPEFVQCREQALARRTAARPKSLLIALGGVDADNVTGRTLHALQYGDLPDDLHITLVMGPAAPWRETIREMAAAMPSPTQLIVGAQNMATLMVEADAAIGAAGSTAWERCCLGLPTGMWVLADNQRLIAEALASAGAAVILDAAADDQQIGAAISRFLLDEAGLQAIAQTSAKIVDGAGCDRVLAAMGGADVIAA